jgi:hypothetical protein
MIGGAVVGAAPQYTYKYLVDQLARRGYTVVQTAYPFTFQHEALAHDLRLVCASACSMGLTRCNFHHRILASDGCPNPGMSWSHIRS